MDKIGDCKTLLKMADRLKTIDFLQKKVQILDDCGGKLIDKDIEHANEKVIDQLGLILEKDQESRNQVRDSLGNNFTFEGVLYYKKKYGDKVDSLNYIRFDKLVDSIGEWPGVNYVPRQPQNPNTAVLVAHFPEKGYVKYVKMAINAAHQKKEFWGKVKLMVEYSGLKTNDDLWEKEQKYIFPFRFIEINKNNVIDKHSELSVLDLENISNRQFVKSDCPSLSFRLSSSLPQKKDRTKLLKQVKALLLEQGMEEDDIVIDFSKQEDYMNYKLFFEELCI